MAEVKVINPARVIQTINGIEVGGYVDGTFIEIERISDENSSMAGANGEVVRVINNDPRHEIRITVMQTSDTNRVLGGLLELDKINCGGKGFVYSLVDLCGTDVFIAPQCWITKAPTRSYGTDVEDRVWTIHTGAPAVNMY